MNNINCICETFYNCCNIPIKVIDKAFKELYKYGYNDSFNNMYPYNLIKNNIDSLCKQHMISTNLDKSIYQDEKRFYTNKVISINSNIHYIMIEKCNLYFIIGPICTNNKIQNNLVPFRPLSCFTYFEDLLVNIINDKLLFNLNCNCYNTYVRKSIEYIHNNYYKEINIDDLNKYLNINKSYFCNLFKKSTGTTFSNFLNCFRIEKSKKILINENLSLLDVALEVGFNNQNYFTIVFKRLTNQTPSEYRKELLSNKKQVY